jgi:hypothetical protein
LVLPEPINQPPLTCVREKPMKIARALRHGRYVNFQLAEVVVTRELFQALLRLIAELRPRSKQRLRNTPGGYAFNSNRWGIASKCQ